ncbi:hypothetical protein EYE40_15210 [Glaciihabitans arcticus]|uniref:Uncharacterized protein n=1 Tax=Glaciihabitans arcticus TaxID=2668039 RepID=A0A4Q9GQL2_9MICO|nr:hypothetical protein [Glaciihabitans arcticus]TBN55545.1 hypothetical protein EYE40_15210 [Glaciihabitans arcticus]
MPDGPNDTSVPPMIRQGQLVEQIAGEILASVEQPFSVLSYNATYFVGYGESEIQLTHPDGSEERLFPPRTVSRWARELRGVMYTTTAGTWFSMTLAIAKSGAASARFNFTEQPPVDGNIDPLVYVDDLEKYPRPDSAIPSWLRAHLDRSDDSAPSR